MNILIDIGHPAHVHVFRYYHDEMVARGHNVLFTAKAKECTLDLLTAYGLPYELLGTPFSGAIKKVYGLLHFGRKLLTIAKRHETDLFISISSMYAAHVASFMGKPHMVLDDTEHSRFEHMLYRPFSSHILTPTCFEKEMGKKHLRYDSYHELAYLHPNRFSAEERALDHLGISEGEPFSLLRFVSWNAGHDISQGGLNLDQKRELVKEMEKHGRVFISSEKQLPQDLEKYRIRIPAHYMHTVLDAAKLYIGEGASMASECAMLGTPALYINSLDAGTLKEQTDFGLIYSFRNYEGVLETAINLLADDVTESRHQRRRRALIEERVDLTALLVDLSQNVLADSVSETRRYTKKNYQELKWLRPPDIAV